MKNILKKVYEKHWVDKKLKEFKEFAKYYKINKEVLIDDFIFINAIEFEYYCLNEFVEYLYEKEDFKLHEKYCIKLEEFEKKWGLGED